MLADHSSDLKMPQEIFIIEEKWDLIQCIKVGLKQQQGSLKVHPVYV